MVSILASCGINQNETPKEGKSNKKEIRTPTGDIVRIWVNEEKSTILQVKKNDSSSTFFTIDSLDNFILFSKRDSLGKTSYASDFKNNIPSTKLEISAFLDKEIYEEGDSAVLKIRGLNRLYSKALAKVYFPFDSSVYEKRSFPEIFEKIDFRNADSLDRNTLIYKFKVQRTPKNLIVFRLFCYEPRYVSCLKFQGAVGDLPVKIK